MIHRLATLVSVLTLLYSAKLFLPGLRMPFCFSREKYSYVERRFFSKKKKKKREKIPQKGFMYCSYPWERCTLPETAFYWAKLLCWYFMSYQNNLLYLSRSECRMVLSPPAKLFQIEPCPGIEKASSCGKSCTTLWLIQHASLCLIKRWTLLGCTRDFIAFPFAKTFDLVLESFFSNHENKPFLISTQMHFDIYIYLYLIFGFPRRKVLLKPSSKNNFSGHLPQLFCLRETKRLLPYVNLYLWEASVDKS